MNILEKIKATQDFRDMADSGSDALLTDAINASLPKPVPITVQAMKLSAPDTLEAIKKGSSARDDLIQIAKMCNSGDLTEIGIWSATMLMLEAMSQVEYDAVSALVVAAIPAQGVTASQVTAELATIRPQTIGREDAEGKPVIGDDGHQINDIVKSGGVVRGLPIDWSQIP